jgi:hypothetical protein
MSKNTMRVAIYTAIFGDYDELKEFPVQDIDCDLICFSDGPQPRRHGAWRVARVPKDPTLHPRMQAARPRSKDE